MTAVAKPRALVAGWFSFERMGATAGDLLARDVACEWLEDAGHEVEVAHAHPFPGGVDWRTVDPDRYASVVFVCGPFGNGPPIIEFLERFGGKRLVGIDLTMLESLDSWNPFDVLLERDSSRTARPDLSFAAAVDHVPLVGLVLIPRQPEYGAAGRHDVANAKLEELADGLNCARVRIDTRLDENLTGLRSAAEVVSLISRMDLVLTTRLHGLALALGAGVPVIAVDPVAGGAKITRQAEVLGWPRCFPADVRFSELEQAVRECLTDGARREAAITGRRARSVLAETRSELLKQISTRD